jgi:O-acetyl-ADP-ribose deacetylase (regulator of RNase III)
MINFVVGNLLESNAFALVNTVNCEGYMGKGIAYQFKMRFPEMNAEYVKQCMSHKLRPGKLHTYAEGSKLIVNFPTKDKWREKSKMEYITSGLDELVKLIKEKQIPSIAIPPLGSGNGGLIWSEVKQIIIQKLGCLDDTVDIYIYEPSRNYQALPAVEPKLSLSALILMQLKFHLLYDDVHFGAIGLQKTAYFMNVLSHTDYFRFKKGKYGPFDHDIDVIAKKIGEFQKFHKATTNEAYEILLQKLISEKTLQQLEFYAPFINKAAEFTNHFSDSASIEGAGTALFIIQQAHCATTEEVIAGFKQWSEDKAKRFSEDAIKSAINELEQAGFIQETFCGFQIANGQS